MSYREAFLFGWSIAWRQFAGSLALGVPLWFAVGIVTDFQPFPLRVSFFAIFAVLTLILILPYVLRAAVSKTYTGFRITLAKRGYIQTLTYADALQVATLAMIVAMVLGGLYSLIEFPNVQLGLAVEVPLLLFVIYPAIAEAAIYVPYRGFRLLVERR